MNKHQLPEEFSHQAEIQSPRIQIVGANLSFKKKRNPLDEGLPSEDKIKRLTDGPRKIKPPPKKSWLQDIWSFAAPEDKAFKQVLFDVHINCYNGVLALIGPSGSGKSSVVKLINRMHETSKEKNFEFRGDILIDGESIFDSRVDEVVLRKEVGMIFQKANPFPKTIYDNVAYGIRIHGLANDEAEEAELVQEALEKAGLLDETFDAVHSMLATDLSGGQQQRLCIARAIATQPSFLLMDEPTSALDPKSAKKVEELIVELGREIPIVLVTHKLEQARKISQETAFLHDGRVLEHDLTDIIFSSPQTPELMEFFMAEYGREVPFERSL